MAERKEVLLNRVDTAHIMGVNPRTFSDWNISPVGKKGNETFYDLKQVIAYFKEREKKRGGGLTEQRTRLVKAQADKAERESEALEGSLIPIHIIEQVWSDQISAFRARILGIPNKAAKSLLNINKPTEMETLIREYLYEALDELSDYETEAYKLDTATSEKFKQDLQEADRIKDKRMVRSKKKTKS